MAGCSVRTRAAWSLICGNTTKPHDSWFEIHMAVLTLSIRMISFPQSHKPCNIRALHSHRQRTGGCMVVDHMPQTEVLSRWVWHRTAAPFLRDASRLMPVSVPAQGNSAVFRRLRKCAARWLLLPCDPLLAQFPNHLHPAMLHACIHRGLGNITWVIWKVKPVK